MEKTFSDCEKKEGLLISPEEASIMDEALGKIRRRIEDKLRKDKGLILPTAEFLGVKRGPFKKGAQA
jgi:hypothetical protein